uniref:Putative secreted protein n=1 Tax=Anopheles triannulatus TaxID=58253 RepID=A0A2M4B7V1_9DIPT
MLAVIYALMQATTLASPDLRCVPEFSFNVNASTCVCTLDPLHGAPALGPPGTGSDPILTSTIRSLEEQENGHRLEYR